MSQLLIPRTMLPEEWFTVPDCPIQRDTKRHADKASKSHLKQQSSAQWIVHMATLPDGRCFKVDGHTRSLLWEEGRLPVPEFLHVMVHPCQSLPEFRNSQGKDFGTVRFDDGEITVISDLPKKPVWDQKQLSTIVQKIQEAGDDPSEYVDTAFKVSESKFKAWPAHIRKTFEPARTLKAGKAIFKLTSKNPGDCS